MVLLTLHIDIVMALRGNILSKTVKTLKYKYIKINYTLTIQLIFGEYRWSYITS